MARSKETLTPAEPPAYAEPARREPASGAIRMLRLLLVGTAVLPAILALVAGYFSYRGDDARAKASLAEAVSVAEENTIKVLETHQLVAARLSDLLTGLTDAQIRAQEKPLHDQLEAQVKDLPEIAAAWAIDATGHELISARVYPVNAALDQSDRDDFQALKTSPSRDFIWALRAKSLKQNSYQPYFTLARRLQGPNGEFRGVAVVAVSGDYFGSFYRSLLPNADDYTAGVFREDGAVLASYPPNAPGPPPLEHDGSLAAAIAGKSPEGTIVDGSVWGNGRLIAYKRLAGYPVYVTISRTEASIRDTWLGSFWGYLAIGGAAAVGLMLLCIVALRRTRSEQSALAQARDAIAQRAAAESQLHQAQKMEALGQLSAGVAHDFNNLLTIISGNVALLQMRLKNPDRGVDTAIRAALGGCERASQLTTRLLSFSRNEPLNPQPTDVNEVIGGMSEILSRSLGSRIVCETRLAPSVWPVFVDPNLLENSLLNLSLNARDAMQNEGRLTIRTVNLASAARPAGVAVLGDCVAISVGDTGTGMPVEVRDRAFEPFFTTKDPQKGTGLGLSQVAGFASRSGGECAIESTPGEGTTVTLYLPRYAGEGASTREPVTADDLRARALRPPK